MLGVGLLVLLAASPAVQSPAPQDRSVYELHLAIDVPVTVLAGAVGMVRVFWKEELSRETCPCDPASVNALDRLAIGNHSHAASIAGDVTAYGLLALVPLADLVDLGASRALVEDLVVFAETLAINTAVQNTVNFAVARPRPRTYAGDPELLTSAEGYLSFYAGHVATAFAALSAASFTLRMRYGERVWPWIVTALVAGSVAFERVASGHHFPSDVAVGAILGTADGIVVPWLHVRTRRMPIALVPATIDGGFGGVALRGLLP